MQDHQFRPYGNARNARGLLAIWFACSGLLATPCWSDSTPAAGQLALAAAPATASQPAPDFALRALRGPNVRLSELRGDVVVLSFWSSRCNICRQQLSALDRAYGTFRPAGFTVLGVSIDDDPVAAREFASSQGLSYPMLIDTAKTVARAYRVDDLPMMVAIDRFGAVRFVLHARRSDQARDYMSELRKLIDE